MKELEQLSKIYRHCVDQIREKVQRDESVIPSKKKNVLKRDPIHWKNEYQLQLESLFYDECMKPEQIISDKDELEMLFDEFLVGLLY